MNKTLQNPLRAASWLLLNGLLIGFVYAGFALEIQGAKNVALFCIWFVALANFATLSDDVARTVSAEGRSVPAWLNIAVDAGITLSLVWFEAWITGTLLAFSLFLKEGALRDLN